MRGMGTSADAVLPVVVGGDVGAYALLRAFHEEYGVRGVAVVSTPPYPFAHSRIADLLVVPGLADPSVLVETLLEVAIQHPGRPRILLTNADWFIETILTHRDELAEHYLLPFPELATVQAVSNKQTFARICENLSIPTPRTVPVEVAGLPDDDAVRRLRVDLPYPVIGKPASSTEYHYVNFDGKRKVHRFETRQELDKTLCALRASGYRGTFLLQELIPGDETHIGSLTAYRDSHGKVTLLATGRVLLEEREPDKLGIPAAILTTAYPEAMDAAARFLDAVDYRGFANFDFKVDARTGEQVFFEINPRVGRNKYYVTAAGANLARFLVEDQVADRAVRPVRVDRDVLYTVVPLLLLQRHLPDRSVRRMVWHAVRRGAVAHPLRYRADAAFRRRLTIDTVTLNYFRKYHRHPAGAAPVAVRRATPARAAVGAELASPRR